MKQNIGLDLDNTLVELTTIELVAEELGLHYTQQDSRDWSLKCFPLQMQNRIKEYFADPLHMCTLKPYSGVIDKLTEWKAAGHDLFIITARERSVRLGTIIMCKILFGDLITSIDFVDHSETKTKLRNYYNIDIWVDDAPLEVQLAAYEGINTFMITNTDTPYNHYLRNWSLVNNVSDITEVTWTK